MTALIMASHNGRKDAVEILLKAKADPNAKAFCKNNSTALIRASQSGYKEIVELLLNAGANPNIQAFGDHNTALITASEKGDKDIVQILLNAGANPHLKKTDDQTAIMLATENRHTQIVKLLKKAGRKFKKTNITQENEGEEEYQEYHFQQTLDFIRNLEFSM